MTSKGGKTNETGNPAATGIVFVKHTLKFRKYVKIFNFR